jgi:hypothetical protein
MTLTPSVTLRDDSEILAELVFKSFFQSLRESRAKAGREVVSATGVIAYPSSTVDRHVAAGQTPCLSCSNHQRRPRASR